MIIAKNPATAVSLVIRFLAVPVALLGLFGVAGIFGQRPESAIWSAIGMFLGAGVYGVTAWLHHRLARSRLEGGNGT
jgi:hypothetical protein